MNTNSVVIDKRLEGTRLDACLSQVSGLTRSRCSHLIEGGHVLLDGCPSKNKTRVKEGQQLVWEVPEPSQLSLAPENIPIEILYQDEDIAFVNKPRGMVVHPGAGVESGTLVNALLYQLDHLSGINGALRPGIVHRLDKDTSGALLIAKNDLAHQGLSQQIAEKTACREYIALVLGNIKEEQGTIDAPIGRHRTQRKRMAVVEGGREARTHFRVIYRFGNATLVCCRLETGRTHQIRVHMAYIGHPVLNDPVYGPKSAKHEKGQLLHAARIAFMHPRTEKHLCFYAPLDEYFSKQLKSREINTETLYKIIWP